MRYLLLAAVLTAAPLARAQHAGHGSTHAPPPTPPSAAVPAHADSAHAGMDHGAMGHGPAGHGGATHTTAPETAPMMTGNIDPAAPMSADGSGTARLPALSPMQAAMGSAGAWSLMLHGSVHLRYTAHDAFGDGSRGASSFDAPNWLMGAAQRGVGENGRLTLRAMLSLDPLTEGGDGYPLLFQTGETHDGVRLVDRQHPHDLAGELSATFAQRVAPGAAVFGYAAYPGEPALGPTAFMHRPSSRHNPDAPLGHHWQDATHIVWGVATAGATVRGFTLEGSLFTGREPDEDRYAPDAPRFDSYSARLTWSPTPRLALQTSVGSLREPEALEPGVDQTRTTASVLYAHPVGRTSDLATAVVWGMNRPHDEHDGAGEAHGTTHSVLAEADLQFGPHAVYGRAEWSQKAPEELALDEAAYGDEAYSVGGLTLGAARDLLSTRGLLATLGAQATLYAVPERLRPLYGAQPVALQVYLRLTPARMLHGAHAGHAM